MEIIDPYMMPEYYMYDQYHSDLTNGIQMMNIVELNHQPWQPYPMISYAKEDYVQHNSAPTKLNPAAPDFNPRNMTTSPPPNWTGDNKPIVYKNTSEKNVMKVYHDKMKMPAVSMDFVIAANYMLNDIFGFIAPQLPRKEKPKYRDDKNLHASKTTHSPKIHENKSSPPSSVVLVKPEISYGKDALMAIAKSPLCQVTPDVWPMIAKQLPRLVRREGPTANILIKEVRAIKKQEEEQTNTDKSKTNE